MIQLGDLFDCFSQSKYPKLFKVLPSQEILEARTYAEELWCEVQKASPKAKCIQLIGNHDSRPAKRLMERCPELEPFMNIKDWFIFDKVKTIFDPREGYEIEDILFIHGFLSGPDKHCLFFNKSVIRGHSHSAGIVFHNRYGDEGNGIFEVQSGYLGATGAMPFKFTASSFTQWRRGITLVEDGVPKFIPL